MQDQQGNFRSDDNLYMNGAEIFIFTLQSIPTVVNSLLQKAKMTFDDIEKAGVEAFLQQSPRAPCHNAVTVEPLGWQRHSP